MEKYIEVMRRSSQLLETVLEGLQHIQQLYSEGRYEETVALFQDAVRAISSIENSVQSLPDEMVSDDIQSLTNNVINALDLVVSKYEVKNYNELQGVFRFTLIPRLEKWKEELEKVFMPYLVT